MTPSRAFLTRGVSVLIFMPGPAGMAHDATGLGLFSTCDTQHPNDTPTGRQSVAQLEGVQCLPQQGTFCSCRQSTDAGDSRTYSIGQRGQPSTVVELSAGCRRRLNSISNPFLSRKAMPCTQWKPKGNACKLAAGNSQYATQLSRSCYLGMSIPAASHACITVLPFGIWNGPSLTKTSIISGAGAACCCGAALVVNPLRACPTSCCAAALMGFNTAASCTLQELKGPF